MASLKGIEHLTEHGRLALWNAKGVAMQYHCGVVGPDHLLLGLYRTQGSIAAYILHKLGLTGKQIESALLKVKPAETGEDRKEIHPATSQLLEQVVLLAVDAKKSGISTDDLLMGLVTFNDVATQAFLAELNLSPDRLRDEIAKLPTEIHPLSAISELQSTQMAPLSKLAPLVRLITSFWPFSSDDGRLLRRQNAADRFTQSASQMMSVAQEIALKYHRGLIGSDHLLLAMFRDNDSTVGQMLRQLKLTEQQIETAMLAVKPAIKGDPIMQLDREAKSVLERTVDIARKMGAPQLDTEHFLLAIVQTKANPIKAFLSELNLTPDGVRSELFKMASISSDMELATSARRPFWSRFPRIFE